MNTESRIKIAMADDHILLRSALATVINDFQNFQVIIEAATGEELLTKISSGAIPDIVLLDLNMPGIGGREAARRIQKDYPLVHVLMLTMYDTEISMIQLLQAGVRGFLRKDISPTELKFALRAVIHTGYYYSNDTTGKLVNLFRKRQDNFSMARTMLTETEIIFLKHACSELTYKEIANRMNLNPRAIDNLRDSLFEKLDVKSRVGLAMYSLRHGIFSF
jgi:two-component system, NarL family, invasion response regulator UvrY